MSILTISDLDAGYGELQILESIDLDVNQNEYAAIIGPNGAGKSTLLKSIFGLTTHFGGTISFDSEEITELDPVDVTKRGIGFVPQEGKIFPDLTVEENLQMGAYSLDEFPEDTVKRIYNRFPVLEERLNQQADTMSGGQRQMLAIARALITDPDLLVFDEPSSGLAPHLVHDLFEEIDNINDSGTPILIVEQNANEVMKRADRGYILSQGQIRDSGDAEKLRNDEEIREKFFGA